MSKRRNSEMESVGTRAVPKKICLRFFLNNTTTVIYVFFKSTVFNVDM